MRHKTLAFTLMALLIAPRVAAEGVRLSDFMEVLGTVTTSSSPVDDVIVVAFNLVDYYHSTTTTDARGAFEISSLPMGVYRIIAVKRGFAPAFATIVPNRRDHRLSLRLDRDRVLSEQEKEDIWAIRRALPSDVLREVDLVLAARNLDLESPSAIARFSGEMVSVTGLSRDENASGFTRTDVGVRGRLNQDWTVDFQGLLQVIDDQPGWVSRSDAEAELSGVVMEVRSEPGQIYRVASTRGRWLEDSAGDSVDESAMESHQLSWKNDSSSLELRYQNYDNLFQTSQIGEAEQIVLAGERRIWGSDRTNVDVKLRIGQQMASQTRSEDAYRTADVGADATHSFGRTLELSYGFNSHLTPTGTEWSPQTRAKIRVGSGKALVLSGTYKVFENDQEVLRFPAVVFLSDEADLHPRYRYSIGFVAGENEDSRWMARATVAEIDSLVRVLFNDHFDEWWDGFYMESGDVHSDFTMSATRTFARNFAVDLKTSAGRVVNRRPGNGNATDRTYLTGTLQSTYRPSGTSLDVTYRYLEQPDGHSLTENERLLLRMAQSLRLPLDVRVLVGVDLSRAGHTDLTNGGTAIDATQTRLIGGVSVAF